MPAAATLIVALMLDGDLAEMTDDVFHLGIASATAFAAKVVEPFDLVHQIVDDGDDNLGKHKMSVRWWTRNSWLGLTVTPME